MIVVRILRPSIMFLIIVVNLILQSTVLNYTQILSIKPNTAVLIIVSYAILRGDIEGSFFGFTTGLMQDFFFGRVIGIHAILGSFLGYACGKPFQNFFKDNNFIPLILSAVSTVVYEVSFYFMNFFFRGKLDFLYYLRAIILPEAIYTTFLSIIIYHIMYSINSRIESVERNYRKLFGVETETLTTGWPTREIDVLRGKRSVKPREDE